MVKYTCEKCKSQFDNKIAYDRHMARITDCRNDLRKKKVTKHICDFCKKSFCRKDYLGKHTTICPERIKIQNIKKTTIKKKVTKNNADNNNAKVNNNGDHNNIKNINKIKNVTINNNIQLPIAYNLPHIDDLSMEDEIAIFKSKENPMITFISCTHVDPNKPQYHNIGYIDKHSGTGHVFNGTKFVEKPIRYIIRDVFESRLKDLEEIHKEIEDILNDKANQVIRDKLEFLNKLLYMKSDPKRAEKFMVDFKKMTAIVKNLLYTNRKLFKTAYEKTNKLNGHDDNDDIPEVNPDDDDLFAPKYPTDEALNYWKNRKNSVDLKQKLAQKLIDDIKNDLSTNDYNSLTNLIINTRNIDKLNLINRLLSKSYCFKEKINCKTIQNGIEKEALINKYLN